MNGPPLVADTRMPGKSARCSQVCRVLVNNLFIILLYEYYIYVIPSYEAYVFFFLLLGCQLVTGLPSLPGYLPVHI